MTAPAMPIVIDHNRMIISLVALALNDKFHYPKYFAMISLGADPTREFSQGIFDVAMRQSQKPKTIAIAAADQEFSKGNADGARRNAEAAGLKAVYDKTYPPPTTDFAPIVRAVQATNPDIFYIASTRRIRSACCAPWPRSASSRSCSAAQWPACRPATSRWSSGR